MYGCFKAMITDWFQRFYKDRIVKETLSHIEKEIDQFLTQNLTNINQMILNFT